MLTYATMLCQPAPTATPVRESFMVYVKKNVHIYYYHWLFISEIGKKKNSTV